LTRGPKAGRIIVPARHREETSTGRSRSFSHIFYSDDHGQSWHLGPNIIPDGNECRLIELAEGAVMMHSRDADNSRRPDRIRRWVAISRDGGDTWEQPYADPALACPQCHASLERLSSKADGGKNRLLFSNPASGYREERHPYGRFNLSVRLSYDEGRSWPVTKTVYPFASSYSDLAVLPDRSIGLIYERGPQESLHYWSEIQFARFDLEWLTGGVDDDR
jgi:sialidase-1